MPGTRFLTACCVGALAASALSVVPATSARGAWQFSEGTLIDIRLACRDGVRAGVAVQGGDSGSDYPTRLSGAQPPPQAWAADTPLVVSAPIVIARVTAPTTVPVDNGTGGTQAVEVSHLGTVTVRSARRLALGPLAVTAARSLPASTVNAAPAGDCYLFAPIDVVPGDRHNKVRIGRGDVAVAVRGTGNVRADRLDAGSFRFGPRHAAPRSHRVRDVDRDGRADLVLTYRVAETGLTCRSSRAAIAGRTKAGAVIEGNAAVQPTGCPR